MEEYENLPTGGGVLLAHQLPEEYALMNSGQSTTHVVRSVWEKDREKYMTLCGNWAKYPIDQDSIPTHWMCQSCNNILNNEMEGYMFDAENEEYYDPTER